MSIEDVRDIYNQIESEMLEEAFKELGKKSNLSDIAWKRNKLLQLKKINKSNAKLIAKYDDELQKELNKIISSEYLKTSKSIDDAFEKIKGEIINEKIDPTRYQKFITESTKHLTGMNKSLLTNFDTKYRRTVIKYQQMRETGIITRGKAVGNIMKEWANTGTPAIIYKNGRQMNAASYADMLLRTESNNTQELAMRDRMKDYGEDLVISSQHSDSSELCQPYQNRIMSLSGKSKKYISLDDAKSNGYKHPNCKHLEFPYSPGISEKEKPIATKKQTEKNYDDLLKQRRLEREVRKSKHQELAAINNKNLPLDERNKIINKAVDRKKYYQKQLREHTAKSGRTRNYKREKIYDTSEKQVTSIKKVDKTPKSDKIKLTGKSKNIDYVENNKDLSKFSTKVDLRKLDSKLTSEYTDNLTDLSNAFPEVMEDLENIYAGAYEGSDISRVLGSNSSGIKLYKSKMLMRYEKGHQIKFNSYFNSSDELAELQKGMFKRKWQSTSNMTHTATHEFAHAIDRTFTNINNIDYKKSIKFFRDNKSVDLFRVPNLNEVINKYNAATKSGKFSENIFRNISRDMNMNQFRMFDYLRDNVSVYSAHDSLVSEFFAETFAKYYYANDISNDKFLLLFDKHFKEELEKVRGGKIL